MPELPFEIWKERINNEIKILKHINIIEDKSVAWHENSVELWINLNTLGFVKKENGTSISVKPQQNHRILIKINRSFPYPGGIDFAWYSDDPLQYDICLEAAEFFKKNSMEELRKIYKQYEKEEAKKDNDQDEIIVIKD